jgi:hypothetical protein
MNPQVAVSPFYFGLSLDLYQALRLHLADATTRRAGARAVCLQRREIGMDEPWMVRPENFVLPAAYLR